jgi:hypothetical protein
MKGDKWQTNALNTMQNVEAQNTKSIYVTSYHRVFISVMRRNISGWSKTRSLSVKTVGG